MHRFRLAAMSAALLAMALTAACSQSGAATARDAPAKAAPQQRATTSKGRGLPAGALRAQRVQIMDMNGFEQPLPALFAFIPVGWRAQGGVQWGNQFMCTNGFNFNWVAQSADGSQTVGILPQERWETNNYGAAASSPGCRSAPISSIQQYLQQLVGRMRPGARVLDYRRRPDLAGPFSRLNTSTPSAMGEMRTWVEAGEALFAFNEQGRDMRGVVAATAVFSLMRTTGLGQGKTMDALTGTVFPGFVATAPNGQLNLQFTEAIRQSFITNPGWQAAIANHNTRIARGAAQEVAKRAKIIADYNDYVSLIRKEVTDMRAKSDERRQREFGEVIRGDETYNDPNAAGGQVQLSNLYNHAWRLNDGSYVLSNDASFDPWKDLGVEGRQLERTQ